MHIESTESNLKQVEQQDDLCVQLPRIISYRNATSSHKQLQYNLNWALKPIS